MNHNHAPAIIDELYTSLCSLNSWEICLSMRELKVRGARENCVWHAGNLKTKINHS